ncbi:MAG: RIO1 family regulatory kinase/ATPase domain-containing protein [Promethearchaeota archaeon]
MFAAEKLNKLSEEELRVLMGVEQGMRKFKFVPVNHIAFFARFDKEKTQYLLDKAHKMGVLLRNKGSTRGDPVSYVLNYEGYDILALHALYSKKIVKSIGKPRGRGKESDVFECLTFSGEPAVIKFHRLGQTSFRNIRRLRDYVKDRRHINWLYMSRLSAQKEYEALNRINKKNIEVNVPKVYGWNRHAVVMESFYGDELYKFNELNAPHEIFEKIIEQYYMIYSEIGIIHGDLGEFNIVLSPDDEIMIIDWPQWVSIDHPHAEEILRRDITNISEFFRKKYRFESNPEEIAQKIMRR